MSGLTTILNNIPVCQKYFFVDTENISIQWLDQLEESIGEESAYHEDDAYGVDEDYDPYAHFVVMYTDKTPHISYDDCIRLAKYISLVTMIRCYPGGKASSALDFQMVSIIGYVLKEHPDSDFVIVSKDKGYDPVVQLWSDAGYSICREALTTPIQADEDKAAYKTETVPVAQPEAKALTQAQKDARRNDMLAKWLNSEKAKDRQAVKYILDKYSARAKGNVYLDVVKSFGQKKGLEIYRKVRPHLKEYEELK